MKRFDAPADAWRSTHRARGRAELLLGCGQQFLGKNNSGFTSQGTDVKGLKVAPARWLLQLYALPSAMPQALCCFQLLFGSFLDQKAALHAASNLLQTSGLAAERPLRPCTRMHPTAIASSSLDLLLCHTQPTQPCPNLTDHSSQSILTQRFAISATCEWVVSVPPSVPFPARPTLPYSTALPRPVAGVCCWAPVPPAPAPSINIHQPALPCPTALPIGACLLLACAPSAQSH